jgi:hypothetical protein
MLNTFKRYGRKVLAAGLNDHRKHLPYSYGWLNNLCWELVSKGGAAELRPAYTWGAIHGAALGKALGMERISIIEFGVAGGRGLVCLDEIARNISSRFDIGIDVYGFDTGEGLPFISDARDLPNLYSRGDYRMDIEALRGRLQSAALILGPIRDTISSFIESRPAPVAFVSMDVDFYTSTIDALRLFEGDESLLLPRIQIYFDDIIGLTFGDHNGERAAIATFNSEHQTRKISPIYGLRYHLPYPLKNMAWTEQMYMAHEFDHSLYSCNDGLIQVTSAPVVRH